MPDRVTAEILEAYSLIYQACRQRQLQTRAAAHTVSTHQANVLIQLETGPGLSLGDLALRMGVTLSTMSLVVDRLERLGLIRRARDRADARRVLVRLTPLGRRVRSERSLLDPARVEALLDQLTPEERAAGITAFAALARAARALVAPAPASHSVSQ
jgi:DNA-binding MarR family transcriptional regulator